MEITVTSFEIGCDCEGQEATLENNQILMRPIPEGLERYVIVETVVSKNMEE